MRRGEIEARGLEVSAQLILDVGIRRKGDCQAEKVASRADDQQFPFPLPPAWLRDDDDHKSASSECGSSARSIIRSTTSTLRSSSTCALRKWHPSAPLKPAGVAWIDKLVLDPLEDNFGEAQDRIRVVSDISPQGGGGLGTSRQWPRKGPRCPW